MARFSIYKRRRKTRRTDSRDQRLSVQQLEQRLPLSAAPIEIDFQFDLTAATGGFVSLSSNQSINRISDIVSIQGVLGRPSSDFLEGFGNELSGDTTTILEYRQMDQAGAISFSSPLIVSEMKSIPLPSLFPEEPEAGTVPIAPAEPTINLPQFPVESEAERMETGYETVVVETNPASTSPWLLQGRADNARLLNNLATQNEGVVPTRGREISFRVASIALPRTITDPFDAASLQENAGQADVSDYTSSPPEKEASYDDRQKPNGSADAQQSAILEHDSSAASQPQYSSQQHSSGPTTFIPPAAQPNYTVTSQKVVPAEVAEPVDLAPSDEQARQHVFATWPSRDRIAVSTTIALAAGPLLVRRRNMNSDAMQLPPEKKPK